VSKRIEQEYLFDRGQSPLPFENGILGYVENPARSIQPDSFGSGVEHINDETDGLSYSGHERVLGRGEKSHARFALHDWSLSMMLSIVS
jgi:hypothetical protein